MSHSRALAIAFASSATFAMILASTVAVADGTDADHDGVPDSLEDATQRTVAATSSGDEFNISSRLVSGPQEDQFEVSYKAGTFEVWYGVEDSVTSSYELTVQNLVEWTDTNGNRRIDPGELGPWTALGPSAFEGIPIVRSNRTDADGGRVFNFMIRSNTSEVTLNVTIAQRFMRIGDGVLTPMEVLVDVGINHAVSHPEANLGVELRIRTEDDARPADRSWDELHGFARDEGTINVTGRSASQSASVFFSWASTALGNGGAIPVNVTMSSADAHSYTMYVAYSTSAAAASSVVHHTTLGVESALYADILAKTPELRGDILLYAGSLVAMTALVAVTILFANRRRKKRLE